MIVWADFPRDGEKAGASYRQRARIVEAYEVTSRDGGNKLLRISVSHQGEHCRCWPMSVLDFKAERAGELYGLFQDLFEDERPKSPRDLVGRAVFALTPSQFSNATYGLVA
jgi:hypothetical protein